MEPGTVLLETQSQRRWSYLLLAAGCLLLVPAFCIGLSDHPLCILSLVAAFFALVLSIVYRFANPGRRKPAHHLLYWAPRALCIAIAMFVSMLGLCASARGKDFWQTILFLLANQIPTCFVLIVLAASWRWEWVGAAIPISLVLLFTIRFWGKCAWGVYAFICGPPLLVGGLFLLNWLYRDRLRARP